MALRTGQTNLIFEDASPATGHIRVKQGSLIFESIPPPTGKLRIGQGALIVETLPASFLPPGKLRIGQGVLILETLAQSGIPSVEESFQDPLGNPIANGIITFQLSADAFNDTLGTLSAISSGKVIVGRLDSGGNLIQPFPLWPNSLLTPVNTYYKTKVFTSGGQLIWLSPVIVSNTYPTATIAPPQI